jgi:predicted Zn finger-like uncharacterized protein
MTESFVTQCPHCQTSFRVSHNQLSVARGVVRCGSCLQVFNAARQLLEQSAAQTPLTPANLPRPPAISQREWAAAEPDLDQLNFSAPARIDALSASRDDGDDADQALPPIIERQPALEDDALMANQARTEPSFSYHGEIDEPQAAIPEHDEPSMDGRGLSAIDEHDDEPARQPSPAPAPRHSKLAARSEPRLRDDNDMLDLIDDPMQLAWEKQTTPWGKRLLWTALAIVAALGLLTQYVVYHFAELARQDQYRPIFQQLCPVLGCTVPSKVDIALIKSSNLVVRTHPEFAGALVVDAIIYNRATFSQPFPLLELRFADLNGALIASRRFKPAEYLNGDLAGQADMPTQTPIHIALDILDPGPKAVNYSLSFRSPE